MATESYYGTGRRKNAAARVFLKAGNGETILSSEMYKSKASCNNGIASVKKNAGDPGRYDRRVNKYVMVLLLFMD